MHVVESTLLGVFNSLSNQFGWIHSYDSKSSLIDDEICVCKAEAAKRYSVSSDSSKLVKSNEALGFEMLRREGVFPSSMGESERGILMSSPPFHPFFIIFYSLTK